jgi:hypothetical protein
VTTEFTIITLGAGLRLYPQFLFCFLGYYFRKTLERISYNVCTYFCYPDRDVSRNFEKVITIMKTSDYFAEK